MSDLKTAVAKAIRDADNSYFSEDYEKQASAALRAVDKAGFVVMPKDAPADIYAKVATMLPSGRIRPEDLVKQIYTITISQLKTNG